MAEKAFPSNVEEVGAAHDFTDFSPLPKLSHASLQFHFTYIVGESGMCVCVL